ncbi:MAG: hypothetical protein PHW04_06725 [Candidatus Wallbacteria bacterium]|nr:hypothetical protein [Candidatus Wallbacteria bacterium]
MLKSLFFIIFILFMWAAYPCAAAVVLQANLDLDPPKVVSISITDTTPGSNHGMIYPDIFKEGQLGVAIEFSEDMKTGIDLTKGQVKIMFNSGRKQTVEIGEWVSNRFWVGGIDSDVVIDNYSDQGKIWVVAQGAQDLAGNTLKEAKSAIYYLDIAPTFSTPKIFPNPISNFDYIVSVGASEALVGPPQVTVGGQTVDMRSLTALTYIGSLHIVREVLGPNAVQVSGIDLHGNTGHWPQTKNDQIIKAFGRLMVSEIGSGGGVLTTPDDTCEISFPGDAVSQSHFFMAFNQKPDFEIPPGSSFVGDRLIAVYPQMDLGKKATITLKCDQQPGCVGLFTYRGNTLDFVGKADYRNGAYVAETRFLGPLAFITDSNSPVAELQEGAWRNDKYRASVKLSDDLSGVDWTSVRIDCNGSVVTRLEPRVEENRVEFDLEYASGRNYSLTVDVSDLLGNNAKRYLSLKAPAVAGLNYFRLYPQPALGEVNLDYSYNQVPSRLFFRLFDSAGIRVLSQEITPLQTGSCSIRLEKRGRKIASGVYFYKLQSDFGGNYRTEQAGKISVLDGEGK